MVRGPRVSGTRDANTAASPCRGNRAAPSRLKGRAISTQFQGRDSYPHLSDTDTATGWERPAKKWRGIHEREWNTRVHGRNSMNWYRLAAHFVPRSRSCGSLVKRSDPFLPPPLSLLVVDSHHSRAFFSLLSFSPAGGREPSHEGSGSRRGFFSLLSLSSLLSNDETNGESRSSERCFTFVSYVYGGSYFGRCSLTGTSFVNNAIF